MMLGITTFSSGEIVLLAIITGLPGALIGTGIGAWRKRDNRALGALIGFIVGFFTSFAIAAGAILLLPNQP